MLDLGTLSIKVKAETDDAKSKLQGVRQETDKLSQGAKKSSEEMSQAMERVNSGCAKVAAAVAVSGAAALTAFAAMAKSALDGYAAYEQNIGGIQKLFGTAGQSLEEYAASVGKSTEEVKGKYESLTRASQQVVRDADEAWRTAQISANTYMEQVTSFSASLITSLGGDTEKAAAYAKTAMVDMSDNAATFGTNIADIQHAYQGFAKQNYTMLDNLKLGYGGTKEEMERLISDANRVKEANGEMANLSIDSFADMVEAIHTIQTEMGIAGTTEREALTTIEGSVNSCKAAWDNWLAGLGNDSANISQLTANLVDSIATMAANVVPRVIQIVQAIITEIPKVFDSLVATLPAEVQTVIGIIEGILPAVAGVIGGLTAIFAANQIASSIQNITGFVRALWVVLSANPLMAIIAAVGAVIGILTTLYATNEGFRNQVNEIFAAILPIITQLGSAFMEFASQVAAAVMPVITQLVTAFTEFINFIMPLIQAALPAIGALFQTQFAIISTVVSTAFSVISTVITTVMAVIQGVISAVLAAISGNWSGVFSALQSVASAIFSGISSIISSIMSAIGSIISSILSSIKSVWDSAFNSLKSVVSNAMSAAGNAVSSGISTILSFFSSMPGRILGALGNLGGLLVNAGHQIIDGFLSGLKSAFGAVQDFVGGIGSWIAAHKGPKAYDLALLIPNGGWIMESLATGLKDSMPVVQKALDWTTKKIAAYQFDLPDVNANFESYKANKQGGGKQNGTYTNTSVVVNNYSPKSLSEKESAREFKRSLRQMALA